MNKKFIAAAVLAAVISGSVAQAAESEREKCFGVAKAGKNDCASKDGSNSCAGQAKKDANPNDWIFVPKGLCDKLAGGKTS